MKPKGTGKILAALLVCVMLVSSTGVRHVSVTATIADTSDHLGNTGDRAAISTASTSVCVPDDYPTIQAAVDAASSGATIVVRAGTYPENIDVNKSDLTIESEDGADVTIVQAAASNDHVFHVNNVDGVRITGFTIRGATAEGKGGISLDGANSCEVTDNVVSQNWVGVGLYMARDNNIQRNTFSNNTYGGGVSEDESATCAVAGAVYGMGVETEPEETLDSLRVFRDQELNPAYVDSYYLCSSDIAGILISDPELMFRAATLISKYMPAVKHVLGQGGEDLEITEQGAQEMTSFLRDLRGAVADRQPVLGAGRGTTLIGLLDEFEDQIAASEGRMFSEAFLDSVYCADSTQPTRLNAASGPNNIMCLNNFMDNTTNAMVQQSTNTWNSAQTITYVYESNLFEGFLGNYWGSSYTGSDAYGDGVGDTAYVIDGNNIDNYPLVDPFENYAPAPPESARDDAKFVVDVTIPDGTLVHPGENLIKTWRLYNAGTTTWTTEYRLAFDGGDLMEAPQQVSLDALVLPGTTVDVSVPMVAPLTGGAMKGYWRLENPAGLRFGDTVWVSLFVPHTLTPELAEAIDDLYNTTIEFLDQLWQDSPEALMSTIAENGDFFKEKQTEAKTERVLGLALNLLGVAGAYSNYVDWAKGGPFKMPLPGKYFAGLRHQWQAARNLYDNTWWVALETNDFTDIPMDTFLPGLKYYTAVSFASQLGGKGVEVVGTGLMRDFCEWLEGQPSPFSEVMYPESIPAIQMFETDLAGMKAELLESLPQMSQEEQTALALDLKARSLVPAALLLALQDTSSPLVELRDVYEDQLWNTLAMILLKTLTRTAAYLFGDGWGPLVVAGFWTVFDAATSSLKVSETGRMVQLTESLMTRGFESSMGVYSNAIHGLTMVRDGVPTQTVTGELGGISHYSEGHYWEILGKKIKWIETGSYSLVELTNTSTEEAVFQVMSSYQTVQERRLARDIVIRNVVELEEPVTIPPGETVQVPVYYHTDSEGNPPTKDCEVVVHVYAVCPISSYTGMFHIGYSVTQWQTQRALTRAGRTAAGFVLAEPDDEVETIDNPIQVFLSASPEDMTYEVQIWVTNPLEQDMIATITETVSDDWEILSAPGASANTSQLAWKTQIEAGNLTQVSFTFAYDGDLSDNIVVSGPILIFETPEGEPLGEFIGNSPSLEPILPITGSATVPIEVMPGDQATVSVELQNASPETAEGGIVVSVTDPSGSCVYNETQAFSLAHSADTTLSYLLPAFLEKGLYQVLTEISHAGATRVMWRDVLRVGTVALQVSLNATPEDRVYPDDTITYNISLNNTSSYILNGVTAEVIVPADTVAHNISDNGQLEESMVKWQLPNPLSGGETVELSFQATVMPGIVESNEARPIKTSAQAASEEAFSASSNEVRILLVGSPAPVMGTISGNVDLCGLTDNSGVLVMISESYITTTTSDGNFTVDVPAGVHNITFTYPGFRGAVSEDVMVDAGEEISLPAVVLIIPGDANGDVQVNVLDMILIAQHWGETGSLGWIPADVMVDGAINVLDMIMIGQHWTG